MKTGYLNPRLLLESAIAPLEKELDGLPINEERMSKPADIGGKRLVSLSPNNWAQWLTQLPQVRVKEMLDSDLQWVSRENDVLLKVTSADTGDFLLLNEMRWDMAVLRESPWYQQILQEGLQQGLQQGRQEGEVQLVLRQLNLRFGDLNETVEQRIRELSVEQLERLAEALLEFSAVEELETWLEQQLGK